MRATLFDELCGPLAESLPLGVVVWQLRDAAGKENLVLVGANSAAAAMVGFDLNAFAGRPMVDVFPSSTAERMVIYAAAARGETGRPVALGEISYGDDRIAETTFVLTAVPLAQNSVAILFENVTALV